MRYEEIVHDHEQLPANHTIGIVNKFAHVYLTATSKAIITLVVQIFQDFVFQSISYSQSMLLIAIIISDVVVKISVCQ